MEQISSKVMFLYNTDMTKLVKYELLYHLNFLESMGYKYHRTLDFISNDSNAINLPNDLGNLKKSVEHCYLCELSKSRKNTVFAEGNINADIMFIGEAPGNIDDETGRPFIGRTGELLTKMIENVLKIKREDVYITNIVKCKPPNNRIPFPNEVNLCKAYLTKQIELVNPRIIVALGDSTLSYLLQEDMEISKVRGQTFSYRNITLIPTYHPSFLLRNPSSKKESYIDMLKIKNLLENIN